MTIQGAMHPI